MAAMCTKVRYLSDRTDIPYHLPQHTMPYHNMPYHMIPYHTRCGGKGEADVSFVSIGDEVTHLKTRVSTAEQLLRRTAQVLEQLASEVRHMTDRH